MHGLPPPLRARLPAAAGPELDTAPTKKSGLHLEELAALQTAATVKAARCHHSQEGQQLQQQQQQEAEGGADNHSAGGAGAAGGGGDSAPLGSRHLGLRLWELQAFHRACLGQAEQRQCDLASGADPWQPPSVAVTPTLSTTTPTLSAERPAHWDSSNSSSSSSRPSTAAVRDVEGRDAPLPHSASCPQQVQTQQQHQQQQQPLPLPPCPRMYPDATRLCPSPFASSKLPSGGWPIFPMKLAVPLPLGPASASPVGDKILKPISTAKAKPGPTGGRSGGSSSRGFAAFFARKKHCPSP